MSLRNARIGNGSVLDQCQKYPICLRFGTTKMCSTLMANNNEGDESRPPDDVQPRFKRAFENGTLKLTRRE